MMNFILNMNWIQRLLRKDNGNDNGKPGLSWRLKRQYKYRVEADMKRFREALDAAENPLRPDRRALYAIYHNILLDDQVATQTRLACITVQRAPFEIEVMGVPDDDAKELFDRPWFDTFLREAVMTEFWGHTLLEFAPRKGEEFDRITLIPREHVRPELGDVLVQVNDQQGIPFRNNPDFPLLIELGEPDDLGLLRIAAIPAIRKRYADTDWSIFSERFGMPLLTVRTTTRDKKELDAKEEMAANLGANGYAILDDQDEIDLVMQNGGQNAHKIYEDRIRLADQQIAKIINGQTSTSDEKAWVGSAEVHERILNDFTFARMVRVQRWINERLIPLLRDNGYPLPEDTRFVFTELNQQPGKTGTTGNLSVPAKKKEMKQFYGPTPPRHTCTTLAFRPPDELEDATDGFARYIWKGGDPLKPPDRLVRVMYATLWQGVADGMNISLDPLDARTSEYAMLRDFRINLFRFAAHKAADLGQRLKFASDRSSSEAVFMRRARGIAGMHREWLETEYRAVVAMSRSAQQWNEYMERADLLPSLRYVTAGDERVRKAHQALDGATYPIKHDFWDKYFPPNGWNCRCDVMQTADEQIIEPAGIPFSQIPEVFRHNPGKSRTLFTDAHPYWRHQVPKSWIMAILAEMDIFDLIYQSPSGGQVGWHPAHADEELEENKRTGQLLADRGEIVRLLPIRPVIGRRNVGKKNPDAIVGERIADFKAPNGTHSAIKRAIKTANKQGAEIVVIRLPESTGIDQIIRALNMQKGKNRNVKQFWFILGDKLFKVNRAQIDSGNYPF